VNPASSIVNPSPRGDEIMALHHVLMEHYIQECAAVKKLIATALSDEKDVIYITVTLKREEVRMLVSVEFVPQEKRLMCCSYMTTLSQPGECTPLKTQKLYGGVATFVLQSLSRNAGFSPVLVLLKCSLSEHHDVDDDEAGQNAMSQWLQFFPSFPHVSVFLTSHPS